MSDGTEFKQVNFYELIKLIRRRQNCITGFSERICVER